MFDFSREPGRESGKEIACRKNGIRPLVTIITPFYNAGKYFHQTYRCVINQTFPWFEWLIVDDGSTEEDQVQLLRQLCATDARLILIQKENGGIASARNAGIERASTELIVTLDADDLIVPTYLEVLYWMMHKNPENAWGYTNTVGFQEQEYLWDQPFDSERLKTYNFLTYSGIIRKSALQEIGGYDSSEKHYYEDWHLWLRLLAAGKKPVKSSLYGFWYRRHDTGVLGKINNDEKLRNKALSMIRQAADSITEDVCAKEFPHAPKANGFCRPSKCSWGYQLPEKDGIYSVLLIIPWMRMGGSEVFELEILKNINKRKFSISIVTTVDAPLEWRQKFEQYTDNIFELPSFLEMEDYPEFISYLVQSRRIQLAFITNSYYGYCLVPWLRMEFPRLAILDYVHMEEWYWRRGGYARISSSMQEITEHTFVCNEHTRDVMIKKFGREPKAVTTLYVGADPGWYDPDWVESGHCYKELNIPKEKHIILFPCRMDAQKRPFLMLEIAKEIKKRNLPMVFVAAGEGSLLKRMKEFCAENELESMVYFTGQVEDMRPYYKDAAVTLNCSIREGLSLTSYESFAMGVPVISVDAGGQGELVDEETGKLLPLLQNEILDFGKTDYTFQEISQYADALEEILKDAERYMCLCKACRERILEKYSTDHMTHKLEQAFLYYINDPELILARQEKADALRKFPSVVEELAVLYHEIEGRDAMYQTSIPAESKEELLRIAESKWGRRLIKLFFRLRLNRLWR